MSATIHAYLHHAAWLAAAGALGSLSACQEPRRAPPPDTARLAQLEELSHRLLDGVAPTAEDDTLMTSMADFVVSPAADAAVLRVQDEMRAKGIRAADLDTRAGELPSLAALELVQLQIDLFAYFGVDPNGGDTVDGLGHSEHALGPPCIPVALAVCAAGILHCRQQAQDINETCKVQTCTDGATVNQACCGNLLHQQGADCWNCGITDPNPNAMGCCCQCGECWNDNPTDCFDLYPNEDTGMVEVQVQPVRR